MTRVEKLGFFVMVAAAICLLILAMNPLEIRPLVGVIGSSTMFFFGGLLFIFGDER
jgi:hypothetical protein